MEVRFADRALERLERNATEDGGFSQAVVTAFRKRVQALRAAIDERDLYAMKSFRFEKLKGARSHQHSIRLNDQWRLILEFSGTAPNKIVVAMKIEDYH